MLHVYRSALVLLGLGSSCALAGPQTSLPPTPTTANMLPAPISANSTGTRSAAGKHRARVTYVGGLLNVSADNSSLNGILRDISVATGMKVTGGVADQRVFGNYGPAEPSVVLATLLDGTGTNMVLRETSDNGPRELILTPRSGGVTPPSPQSYGNDADVAEETDSQTGQQQQTPPVQSAQPAGTAPQSTSGPQQIPQPWNNVLGSPSNTTQTPSTIPTVQSVPTDSISTPSVAQPVSGIVDSTNPPPPGSTSFGSSTPTNTNNLGDGTVKTPEQIFQQLQQMRQQSQQQQSTPTAPQNQ